MADDGGASLTSLLAGWDMAYVTSLSRVNAAILAQAASPTRFDVDDKDEGLHLSGRFGPWRLTVDPLAKGSTIVLSVPVVDGTLTVDKSSFPIAGLFHADVKLEFTTDPPAPGENPPTPAKSLVVHQSPVAGHTSATVREPAKASTEQTYAAGLLEAWLNANLEQVAMVFAKALPGLAETEDEFGWILPVAHAYAVSCPDQDATEDNSVFAILGVASLEQLPFCVPQVSTAALPDGADAAYLLSPAMMLTSMIGPSLAVALQPVSPFTFGLISGTGILTNTLPVVLPDFDLGDATGKDLAMTGKTPTIADGGLLVSIEENLLVVKMTDIHFITENGFEEIYVNLTTRFALSLDDDKRIRITPQGTVVGSCRLNLTKAAEDYQVYMTISLAVVTAVLAFLPGVGQEVSAAAKAVGEGAEVATTEAAADATGLAAEEDAALTGRAASELAEKAASTPLKGWAVTLGKKLLSIGGALLVYGALPKALVIEQLIQARSNDKKGIDLTRTLDDVVTKVAEAAYVGNKPAAGAPVCSSVALNRALQIGLRFPTS